MNEANIKSIKVTEECLVFSSKQGLLLLQLQLIRCVCTLFGSSTVLKKFDFWIDEQ